MEKYPHPIHAVVFDNDGTILDTLPIYYEVLTRFVPPPYPESLIHRVNGVSDFDACKIFIEVLDIKMTPEELFEKRKILLNELLPQAKIISGVDEVINKIHDMKIPMIVATGSLRSIHEMKVSGHPEIFSLIKDTVCGDDVEVAKPSPDIFLKALEKFNFDPNLNIRPENILVIEDAINGIVAAQAAGMPSVFVNEQDETFDEKFKEKNVAPTARIKSFKNFPFDMFTWKVMP
ncbi:Pseudouridine-5'-monophosphatase [Tritrichomonas foetus]|uniref:Pseudouridine-5'-monophosphatase n=1 Tax=Tritrichomonas foetus TaxID=1144522 RepID=A0A1J4JN34_9EUKA|nr:Pseudouridine-5'-monophosphatase [Tritrichomonas foetus]|eukprot:OHS98917.1 Pseudouridine-5'-monophosphatase [Tritrichomonas foetus]